MSETGLLKSYSKREFVASFKADPDLWSRFKGECAARGVSICYVLEALMEAWIEGQKAEATVVKPVVVNLTMQHVVERPRRTLRISEEASTENVLMYVEKYGSCHRLKPTGVFSGKIGWCPWLKRWIAGLECETCIHTKEVH
jgi:hypothetical protein